MVTRSRGWAATYTWTLWVFLLLFLVVSGPASAAGSGPGLVTDLAVEPGLDSLVAQSGEGSASEGSFSQVSAGGFHACGLRDDGSIECWGDVSPFEEVTVPDGSFSQVSGGGHHACGLRDDGSIECWGSNEFGQLDAPEGSFSQVAAGGFESCGLRDDGSIECWGQVGWVPSDVFSFSQVSGGGGHTCGLLQGELAGLVFCWGSNQFGQVAVPDGSFSQVSAGGSHSCGLRDDGSIECWGRYLEGQLDVPDGSFSQVSAGDGHTCGLRDDGSIECWGISRIPHMEVTAPDGSFSQVSAGWRHACGLRDDGSIECWGELAFRTAEPPAGGDPPGEGTASEDAGVHQPSIDALNRHVPGVFDGTGCGQGLCPSEALQRWEMAVWLVRVLDRANPSQQATTRFDDVDSGLWWVTYTDRLADLGVTAGCKTEPLRFCPDKPVTRAQMATFLARALGLV